MYVADVPQIRTKAYIFKNLMGFESRIICGKAEEQQPIFAKTNPEKLTWEPRSEEAKILAKIWRAKHDESPNCETRGSSSTPTPRVDSAGNSDSASESLKTKLNSWHIAIIEFVDTKLLCNSRHSPKGGFVVASAQWAMVVSSPTVKTNVIEQNGSWCNKRFQWMERFGPEKICKKLQFFANKLWALFGQDYN